MRSISEKIICFTCGNHLEDRYQHLVPKHVIKDQNSRISRSNTNKYGDCYSEKNIVSDNVAENHNREHKADDCTNWVSQLADSLQHGCSYLSFFLPDAGIFNTTPLILPTRMI